MKKNTTVNQGGFVMALAGNKCDLDPDMVKVNHATSKAFADENNMIWSEVAAKSGKGIEAMFKKVAERVIEI